MNPYEASSLQWRHSHDERRFKKWFINHTGDLLSVLVSNTDLIVNGQTNVFLTPGHQLPSFSYPLLQNGVGQGDGEEGTRLDTETIYRDNDTWPFEVSSEEVLELLKKEVDLNSYKPRVYQEREVVTPSEINSLSNRFKRKLIKSGGDPFRAIFDSRKRSAGKLIRTEKESNALIVYMMDVSEDALSSVTKTRALKLEHWIDNLIAQEYTNFKTLYIAYAGDAEIKTKTGFYNADERLSSPKVSAAYDLYGRIVDAHPETNIFLVQFSDGKNMPEDLATSLDYLKNLIIPASRLFGFFQLKDNGDPNLTRLMNATKKYYPNCEHIKPSQVFSNVEIITGLLNFFGRNK